jgi:hypothetical protein
MDAPNEFQPLIDDIYRRKVARAREMPADEKFRAGPELFEMAAEVTLAGIRSQFPDASPERRLQILRERLALRDRLDWAAAPGGR